MGHCPILSSPSKRALALDKLGYCPIIGAMTSQELLPRIAAYCKTYDISKSTFGRKAVNDGKLVARLEEGKTITLGTMALILEQLGLPGAQSAWLQRETEQGAA